MALLYGFQYAVENPSNIWPLLSKVAFSRVFPVRGTHWEEPIFPLGHHNILNLDNIHTRRLPYPNLVKVYQNMCHIMVQNSNIPGSYPRIEAYRHTDTKSQGKPIFFRQKGSCHMFIVQKHYSRKYSAIFSWVSLREGAPATPQRKPIISATGLQNIFEIVEELGERGILKISLLYNHNHKRVQSGRKIFLPDPGVSGVRSMGPGVSMSVHTSGSFVKLC